MLTMTSLTRRRVMRPASGYAGEAGFFVRPNGSDANDGSPSSPWRTLENARNRMRFLLPVQNDDLTLDVQVKPSLRYDLFSQDSARNGNRVKLTGSIDCTVQITDWSLWNSGKGMWRAPYGGNFFRDAWLNDVRCYRSRRGSGLVGATLTSSGYSTSDLAGTKNPFDVELRYYNYEWTESVVPVASIGGGAISMRPVPHAFLTQTDGLFFTTPPVPYDVENCWEDFFANATDGTFYFDEDAGFVYYCPRSGEDMENDPFTVPSGLETAILASGLRGWDFENLTVKGTGYDIRQTGFVGWGNSCIFTEANPYLGSLASVSYPALPPSAVVLKGCEDVHLIGGAIKQTSASGFHRTLSCVNCTATGVAIADIGANGMDIGESAESLTSTASSGCHTRNCRITDGGRNFRAAVLAQIMHGSGWDFEHNELARSYYLGLAVGSGLSYHPEWQENKAGNSRARFNRVSFTHLDRKDGGAMYVQATQNAISGGTGLLLDGNYITDVRPDRTALSSPNAGTYLDQGTSGVTLQNHVYRRCGVIQFFNGINEGPGEVSVGTCYADAANSQSLNSPSYTEPTIVTDFSSGPAAAIIAAAGPETGY